MDTGYRSSGNSYKEMDKIKIRKFLLFFIDEAERLISQHDLEKNDLESLNREFIRFLDQIKSANGTDPLLIQKLTEINLNPRKNSRRSGMDSFIRILSWIRFDDLLTVFAADQVRKKDIRDTIIEFRDRISQISFGINTYKI